MNECGLCQLSRLLERHSWVLVVGVCSPVVLEGRRRRRTPIPFFGQLLPLPMQEPKVPIGWTVFVDGQRRGCADGRNSQYQHQTA